MFSESNAVLENLKKGRPDVDLELKFNMRLSPIHVGVPMGEHNLLQWVNTFIFINKVNGRLQNIQEKWFHDRTMDLPAL